MPWTEIRLQEQEITLPHVDLLEGHQVKQPELPMQPVASM